MVIPAGYAQANLVFTGAAVPRGAQVTLGLLLDTPNQSPAQVAANVGAAWEQSVLTLQMSSCVLQEVRAKVGPNDTGLDATVSFQEAGSVVSPGDSPQVAILVRKVGAIGGRKNQGRMFVPGVVESATDTGGTLASGQLAVWQAEFNDFLALLISQQLPPVVLHNEAGVTPTLVQNFVVQNLLATQRRRLRKVGGRRRVGV